jgi:hypothetical protein
MTPTQVVETHTVKASRPTDQRRYGGMYSPVAVHYSRRVVVDGMTLTWTGWAEAWPGAVAAFRAGTLRGIGGALYHENGQSCHCTSAAHEEYQP